MLENEDKIRAAKEISFVSIEIPKGSTNERTIGKNDLVARAGASSVIV